MANLKNITDLPVAESADGLNLIVNDNGAAKQIAASAVGAQADWAETDENSPAFVKNKPVEELDLDITVDILLTDSGFEYSSHLNHGTFYAVKNKILNNEGVKFKTRFIMVTPEDKVGYENNVIFTALYAPQDFFGTDSNPEMIMLLTHSYIIDAMMEIDLLSDNTVEVYQY